MTPYSAENHDPGDEDPNENARRLFRAFGEIVRDCLEAALKQNPRVVEDALRTEHLWRHQRHWSPPSPFVRDLNQRITQERAAWEYARLVGVTVNHEVVDALERTYLSESESGLEMKILAESSKWVNPHQYEESK